VAGLIQATATSIWLEVRHGEAPRVIEDVVKTDVAEARQQAKDLERRGKQESAEEKEVAAASRDTSAGETPAERIVSRLRGKRGPSKKPAA
jgi:hypothetical protein